MARSLPGAPLMEAPLPEPDADSVDYTPIDLAALAAELADLRTRLDALMSDVLLLLWDTQPADGPTIGPEEDGQGGWADSDAPAA